MAVFRQLDALDAKALHAIGAIAERTRSRSASFRERLCSAGEKLGILGRRTFPRIPTFVSTVLTNAYCRDPTGLAVGFNIGNEGRSDNRMPGSSVVSLGPS